MKISYTNLSYIHIFILVIRGKVKGKPTKK